MPQDHKFKPLLSLLPIEQVTVIGSSGSLPACVVTFETLMPFIGCGRLSILC